MLLHLEQVVTEPAARALAAELLGAPFVEGTRTAAPGAAPLKNNLQLPGNHPIAIEGARFIATALAQSAAFQAATLPVTATAPRFCRYEAGMGYGDHQDSPFMAGARRIRTDIAVTVALSPLDGYEGGELVVDSDGAAHTWKGHAGDCVVYPADTLHRVQAVTSGTRSVAIFWIQSLVRDAARRKLLFDLWLSTEALAAAGAAAAEITRLRECRAQLLRLWVEP